jgi:hypothetical protein
VTNFPVFPFAMATLQRVVVQLFPNGNKFDFDLNREESLSLIIQHACQVLLSIFKINFLRKPTLR